MKALLLHAAIGIGTLCSLSLGGCVSITTTNPAPVAYVPVATSVQASNNAPSGRCSAPCCQQAGYTYAPQPNGAGYPNQYPPYAGAYPPASYPPQGYPAQYPQYPAQYPQYPAQYPQYPQGYPAQYPPQYPYYYPPYQSAPGTQGEQQSQTPGGSVRTPDYTSHPQGHTAPGGATQEPAGGPVGGAVNAGHPDYISTPRNPAQPVRTNDGRTPPVVADPVQDNRVSTNAPTAEMNPASRPPVVATPTRDTRVTTPSTAPAPKLEPGDRKKSRTVRTPAGSDRVSTPTPAANMEPAGRPARPAEAGSDPASVVRGTPADQPRPATGSEPEKKEPVKADPIDEDTKRADNTSGDIISVPARAEGAQAD